MNSVAKNLKTIRLKAGYTQSDLAQALHVTRQTVSSWETGRNEPDIESLTALAEYLQTDVTTLIYGPKAPPYQTMQKKYRDRLELFYPVRDEKNCERTYQIINNIGGER